jgi:DNA-binding transcriptional regulator YdaS (Cro superfamily)
MNLLLKKACDLANGQTGLARELTQRTKRRVTQQQVRNWLVRGDEVPTDVMAPIEEITNGEVSRKDFRPNDFHIIWPELAERA